MGLDNMFYLKDKKDSTFEVQLGYFRKYFELDNFFRHITNNDSVATIPEDEIKILYNRVHPIYMDLVKLPNEINYYDETGYPEELDIKYEGNPFYPGNSSSFIPGVKLFRLHSTLEVILELLDEEDYDPTTQKFAKKYYLEFLSSW